MIFVIMGKSATGKDTIFDRLIKSKELGLTRIVPYTTRPQRRGEVEGHEYHFVDEAKMNSLKEAGLIAEHRQYDTVHGIWHYFTVDDNELVKRPDTGYAMIGTLEAYVSLKTYYGADIVVPIYVTVNDFERLRRAINREKRQANPNCEEVCRRYIADERDFSEQKLAQAGINKYYVNDNIKECVADICNDIKNIRYKTLNVLY